MKLPKFSVILLGLVALLTMSHSFANDASREQNLVQNPKQIFEQKITLINRLLHQNQTEFRVNPAKLVQFVDAQLLSQWSAEKTLTGLLGKSSWDQLSQPAKNSVEESFNNTFQRYVQESFQHYEGQSIEFVDIQLNEAADRGLLTVEVVPNLLPRFKLHLKIYQENQQWMFYDAMVQGASYVSMKKDSFRSLMSSAGLDGFLLAINAKNEGFLPSGLSNYRKTQLP